MAVVGSAVLMSSGGSDAVKGKVRYASVYQVTTDDADDLSKTVLAATGLPALESAYSAGNESDADARCILRTPTVTGNRKLWFVECVFESPTTDGGGPNAQGSFSILVIEPDVSIRWQTLTEQYNTDASGKLVMNSAGVRFKNPPERQKTIKVLRVSRNLSYFDDSAFEVFRDKLNANPVRINLNNAFFTAAPFELLMQNLESNRQEKEGVRYWRITFECMKGEWIDDILDKGFVQKESSAVRTIDGESVYRQGYGYTDAYTAASDASGLPVIDDQLVNGGTTEAILDSTLGLPVNEEVFLDGQGRRLDDSDNPVFLRFWPYAPISFIPLLPPSIFSPLTSGGSIRINTETGEAVNPNV